MLDSTKSLPSRKAHSAVSAKSANPWSYQSWIAVWSVLQLLGGRIRWWWLWDSPELRRSVRWSVRRSICWSDAPSDVGGRTRRRRISMAPPEIPHRRSGGPSDRCRRICRRRCRGSLCCRGRCRRICRRRRCWSLCCRSRCRRICRRRCRWSLFVGVAVGASVVGAAVGACAPSATSMYPLLFLPWTDFCILQASVGWHLRHRRRSGITDPYLLQCLRARAVTPDAFLGPLRKRVMDFRCGWGHSVPIVVRSPVCCIY